jgi:micrococcal nuclease
VLLRLMNKAFTTLIPFSWVLFFLLVPCRAWAWSGRVVDVAAGVTITVLKNGKSVEVLLYEVECPEEGQSFSDQAKEFTSKMVFDKVVEVYRMDTDRQGRTVALVAVDKSLLNEKLVKAGLAWVYSRYCSEVICETWKNYQLKAKIGKRGLWSDPNPISPWEFRKKK